MSTIMVYLLTETQKDLLVGVRYNNASFFNPVQDGLGRWIITIEEISQNTNQDVLWINDLPAIEWIPPIPDEEGGPINPDDEE